MNRPPTTFCAASITLVLLLLVGCGRPLNPNLRHTPTPEGPVTIHITPDGSGDYATLVEAVQQAPPGARILLAAGTYRLEDSLEIDKPLSLVGAGADQSKIVADRLPYILRIVGDGPFTIESLAVQYEGQGWADVMVVEGGEIHLTDCQLAGRQGSLLSLLGNTTGTVSGCTFGGGRGSVGIWIKGQAQPTVEGNTSSGNGYGIRLTDQAQPRLLNNVLRGNLSAGIKFDGMAGGEVRQNDCSENNSGIIVSGQAQPTLVENTASGNSSAGLTFQESAGGIARGNDCSKNLAGIGVMDQARPLLDDNLCSDNQTAGIAFFNDAAGIARNNRSSGNGVHGIAVFDQAQPILEGNVLAENGQAGISFQGNAGGIARGNECSGNPVGIVVAGTAKPTLEANDCS